MSVPTIHKLCDTNIGGLRLLRVIPVAGVSAIPAAVGHEITTAITLAAGASIADVFFTEDTGSFEEDPQINDAGKVYRQSIECVVAKDAPGIADYVNRYDEMQCIVMYMDSNGFAKIVGSIAQPLTFRAQYGTGRTPEERNAYRFSYTGTSYHKAYFYTQFGNPITGGRGYSFASPTINWSQLGGLPGDSTDLINLIVELINEYRPL